MSKEAARDIRELAELAKKHLFDDDLVRRFMESDDPDGFFEVTERNGKER